MNPARAALGAALAVGLTVSIGAPAPGQCLAHELDVLTEDELPAYDAFGLAVAMDGDVAVIGDVIDADSGVHAGAAFVFRFDGSAWIKEQKLLADDGAPSDLFGGSVAVSGDTIVIGARYDDDLGNYSGSAYVFRSQGSRWVFEQKLL
ncbi:MAG: FG-GAP repeat protein, partial [Planctomycetota bacterium]